MIAPSDSRLETAQCGWNEMLKLIRKALHSARPDICDDVAVWGRRQGLRVWDIHKPIYEEVLPLTRENAIARSEFEIHEADYRRPQSLVVIPGARVRDAVGFVFLPDGSVCYQGNWARPFLTQNPSYQARFRRKRLIKGDVFSLLGFWSGEFYHWFHDTLPRLWNSLPYLPAHTRFLIHGRPKPYQLDSLAVLGVPADRLEYQADRGDAVVERLWFASPAGHSTFSAADTLGQIAGQLKAALGHGQLPGRPRIYVSRGKAASRRVLNESEIEPLLKRHDFQVVLMEDIPFKQQVEICAKANVLIGPHGAGLTNLLYCAPNSKIGEIAVDGVFPHYLGMAHQSGHSFQRFMATKAGEDDMVVDAASFQQWLELHFQKGNRL
jgi:hypothetical protein